MNRRLCALMMILVLPLSACGGGGGGNEAEKTLVEVRGKYLEMTACSGHADLTADYGERVYTYGVDFSWQREGETFLTLTAPEMVAGTTAHIKAGETALEYDGVMLETGPLNTQGLSPVDALPALLSYAREGFAAECLLEETEEGQKLHVICRDPEKDPGVGVEADLWLDPDTGNLLRGELSEGGATVIQCTLSGFAMTLATGE